MKKEFKMSAERYQELKDELNYLKTVREKEVAELIKEARGFGDLSENSEYDEAKNEQGKLYARINARVDRMFELGLAEEVRSLLALGITEKDTAMQAIGYKETVSAIKGECTMAQAAENIKQASRRYAKRQLSWFRRYPEINWILWEKAPDFDYALRVSTDFLQRAGIM